MLLAVAVGRWCTRRRLRHLDQLDVALTAWERGDLSVRSDIRSAPTEVVRLSRRLDATMGRLAAGVERLRASAADAAHELRLPLTLHRLQLELLEPHLSPDGLDLLDGMLDDVDGLTRRLDGVLLLSQVDERAYEPRLIDLTEVLDACVRLWEPHAERLGVRLQLRRPQCDDPCPAAGTARPSVWEVAGGTRLLLDNLISNACKASPRGAVVTVGWEAAAGRVHLTVVDHGCGMPPAQRRLVGERSWRSSWLTHDGAGIGLSLVQRVVTAVHGSMRLADTPGGGLTVHVELPGDAGHPCAGEDVQTTCRATDRNESAPITRPAAPRHQAVEADDAAHDHT